MKLFADLVFLFIPVPLDTLICDKTNLQCPEIICRVRMSWGHREKGHRTKRRRGKITLKWIPPPSPKILDFQASHFSHEAGKVVYAMKINKPKILVLKTTKSVCPPPVSRDLDWWGLYQPKTHHLNMDLQGVQGRGRRERIIMYQCFSLLSCQGPKKSCCYAQGSKEIKSSHMSGKGKYGWALEMFLGIHFIYHKSLL